MADDSAVLEEPRLRADEIPSMLESAQFAELPFEKRTRLLEKALDEGAADVGAQGWDKETYRRWGQFAQTARQRVAESETLGETAGRYAGVAGRTIKDMGAIIGTGAAGLSPVLPNSEGGVAFQVPGETLGPMLGANVVGFTAGVAQNIAKRKEERALETGLEEIKREIDDGAWFDREDGLEGWLDQSAGTIESLQRGVFGEGADVPAWLDQNGLISSPENARLLSAYMKTRDPRAWEALRSQLLQTPFEAGVQGTKERLTNDTVLGRALKPEARAYIQEAADPFEVVPGVFAAKQAARAVKAGSRASRAAGVAAGLAGEVGSEQLSAMIDDPNVTREQRVRVLKDSIAGVLGLAGVGAAVGGVSRLATRGDRETIRPSDNQTGDGISATEANGADAAGAAGPFGEFEEMAPVEAEKDGLSPDAPPVDVNHSFERQPVGIAGTESGLEQVGEPEGDLLADFEVQRGQRPLGEMPDDDLRSVNEAFRAAMAPLQQEIQANNEVIRKAKRKFGEHPLEQRNAEIGAEIDRLYTTPGLFGEHSASDVNAERDRRWKAAQETRRAQERAEDERTAPERERQAQQRKAEADKRQAFESALETAAVGDVLEAFDGSRRRVVAVAGTRPAFERRLNEVSEPATTYQIQDASGRTKRYVAVVTATTPAATGRGAPTETSGAGPGAIDPGGSGSRVETAEIQTADSRGAVRSTSLAEAVRAGNTELPAAAAARWTPEVYAAVESFEQSGDMADLQGLTPIQMRRVMAAWQDLNPEARAAQEALDRREEHRIRSMEKRDRSFEANTTFKEGERGDTAAMAQRPALGRGLREAMDQERGQDAGARAFLGRPAPVRTQATDAIAEVASGLAEVTGDAWVGVNELFDGLRARYPGMTPGQFRAAVKTAYDQGSLMLEPSDRPGMVDDRTRELMVPDAAGLPGVRVRMMEDYPRGGDPAFAKASAGKALETGRQGEGVQAMVDRRATSERMASDSGAAQSNAEPSPGGLTEAEVDESTGLPLNSDGTVTVFHGTTSKAAARIRQTGVLESAGEPDIYFTSATEGTGYGDGTVIAVRIDPERLILDDEFPDGRKDFRVEVGSKRKLTVRLDENFESSRAGEGAVQAMAAGAGLASSGPLPTAHYGALPPSTMKDWSGEVRTLRGIRDKILNAVGLPRAGIGRYTLNALGIFRMKPETIRTRTVQDIPVLAHEVGHAIHSRLLSSDPMQPSDWAGRYDAELMGLGQVTSAPGYTPEQIRNEGVAEFTRLWLTDPVQARAAAPKFADFWDTAIEARSPETARALRIAQDEIADYIAMPAFKKAEGQIVFDPEAERARTPIREFFREAYQKWVNTVQPVEDAVKAMVQQDPALTQQADRLLTLVENHRGGWQSKAHADVFYDQIDVHGNRIGPGLMKILNDIGPGQHKNFSTYLALKRAAEIERQGKRSGFENARLPAAEMRALEARFEPVRQKILKWQDNELRLLEDSGVIDSKLAAKMRAANKDYVPFYRLYEKVNGVGFGPSAKGQQGYVDLSSGIYRLKGSDRAVIDPLSSMMKNAFMFRKLAEQNQIGVQFFDMVNQLQGGGKIAESLAKRVKPREVRHEEIVRKLKEQGVIENEADLPTDADLTLRLWEAVQRPDSKNGEVMLFRNGQREGWEVKDPLLMEALRTADAEIIKLAKFLGPTGTKLATLPTRTLRWGATGGPWFAIPNFIRDQVTAGIRSRTGFVPFVDGFRGMWHAMAKSDVYQRWVEAGGKYHGIVTGEQAFANLLQDALPKERNARTAALELINPRNYLNALGYASQLMEEATRVREFERGVRQGMTPEEAANASKAVSLNFARAGERARVLNMLVPFFNAKIQELDTTVQMHRDPKRRGEVMTKGLLYVTVPSVLTWLLGKDDPEIQNLPEWRKNLFWNLNLAPVATALGRGDGFVLSIPKPFLMGALYGTSVERALDYATERDPNGMKKALSNVATFGLDGLNPLEMVMGLAGARPMIEAATNHDRFRDAPIVPEHMTHLPAENQYDLHTSETAKLMGRWTGQSPMMIDHLIRGYFATAGKWSTGAIDWGMAKLGLADVPEAPSRGLMEMPILNRFAGSPYAANAFVERFYESARDMEGKLAVWNKQSDQMTTAEQKRWWDANGPEVMHYLRTVNAETGLTGAGEIRKAMAAMSEMSKAMKEIQQSRVLKPEVKRERMMELTAQRNQLAEGAFKNLFPEPVRKRHY